MKVEEELGSAFPLNEGCMDIVQIIILADVLRAITHTIHTCLDQYQYEGQA